MIQNISIEKLHPHPDNPRKDLGDLTELAESIKANGVLQNLTVVPWFSTITGVGCDDPKQQEEMGYIVIIGHRRMAAAKLAGLTKVPCSITEMTKQEQVATMLLENMQRSDLTIYEQAQGFQMLLNFGESVADISEKTGFSETTVRRRVKLLELDGGKLKESAERGSTLTDYVGLEKIEDIKLRNKVLDSIGTSNFNYELRQAIDSERKAKWRSAVIEQLDKFATEVKESNDSNKGKGNGLRYVSSYYSSQGNEIEIPDDAGETKYFYVVSKYGYVTLYGEPKETEEDTAAKEKRELQKARYNALGEISKRAFDLRYEFVKSISNAKAKKNFSTIIKYCISTMLESYSSVDAVDLAGLLDITLSEDDDMALKEILQGIPAQPEKYMFLATYCLLDDNRINYYKWDCSYENNKNLNQIYDFLEALGYEISDEEKAMRDGTHELLKEGSAE